MTSGQPFVYFLHYWGTGPAEKLAAGFRAALDQLGPGRKAGVERKSAELTKTVVFVCEHGSAKSIVAAAHFNLLAEHQGLPWRAVARGIAPDSAIPEQVVRGLAADGIDVSAWRPSRVDEGELSRAARIITLACQLPQNSPRAASMNWDDLPSISEEYEAGRTAIVTRVQSLLARLAQSELN
jgi:arsenate reductase (thioredoxin)